MFLSGDSQEDTNGVSSSSFFILFFSDGFNSSLVDHILSSFQMLSHAGASHNCSPLSILIRSAQDISEDSCFHSQQVQAIWRLLSHSSHLIQPTQSPFQSIVQRCFPFEWALIHRSFSKILPGSSNFPGAIPKFISKFDVRMNYHQSYVLLQDLSNSFHRWFNLSNFSSRSISTIHGGVSRCHSRILKTEE